MSENEQVVIVVDDDAGVRDSLSMLLESVGLTCRLYCSADELLQDIKNLPRGCLVLDIRMPGMSGLELQAELHDRNVDLPIIFITGHGDILMAVEAMRRGALDFIPKPFREQDLLDRIHEALACDTGKYKALSDRADLLARLESLSNREREVFELVADGHPNKVIAFKLGVSERTIEVHRSRAMKKLGVTSLAEMVRMRIEEQQTLDRPVASFR